MPIQQQYKCKCNPCGWERTSTDGYNSFSDLTERIKPCGTCPPKQYRCPNCNKIVGALPVNN